MSLIQLTGQSREESSPVSRAPCQPSATPMLPTSAATRPGNGSRAPKPSFSLLGRGQREYETLGVGVIANRLAMGRVAVDRLVGKMAA